MLSKYKFTDKEKEKLLKSIVILIDRREKSYEHITKYFDEKKIPYIFKSLSYGDYSFFIKADEELSIPRDLYFDREISIERKGSLEELSGNLSQERDRFEKELSLFKGKMFLMVENASYHDIYENNYNTKYNKKSFLGSLHSFNFKYNLPFVFMPKAELSGVFIFCTFYYYLRDMLN